MSEYHRLTDQKYSEAEYLFQTIEMAKSDEEFDEELCSSPPSNTKHIDLIGNDPQSIYSWKVVSRRRPRRRYTVSHGGGGGGGGTNNAAQANGSPSNGMPPAPPSTPTSLTPTNISLLTSAANDQDVSPPVLSDNELRYFIRTKLRDRQQRTDAELAELFKVVSIATTSNGSSSSTSKMKARTDRGVATASRMIRKQTARQFDKSAFKYRRSLNDYFREPEEEDSVSAPEYDTEEEDTRFHRLGRIKPSRRIMHTIRERRLARFDHQERMEDMIEIFDESMTFNEE